MRRPAEWEKHAALWTAWPDHEDWGAELEPARQEVAAMARAIATSGEQVNLLVKNVEARKAAAAMLGPDVQIWTMPYGDIWLRDTGPIFVREASERLGARVFEWNGWGGKYRYPGDERVAASIVEHLGLETVRPDWVLEGGAIDGDGAGVCLTTRQCLLNPNRGGRSEAEVEERLRRDLGFERVIWLDEGLLNDHTDGHVDTVARFVAPGRVVCMAPTYADPNERQLNQIQRSLVASGLKVETIPSPGEILGSDGALMPASYVNFFIGHRTVVVPTYGSPNDDAAVKGLQALFPERQVIGLSARAILSGGGAFHCITQEQP